ncbi:MAG TPA: hypothetical protein VEO00_12935, partial [Actinomycetota bacterium]|nr:hypothetical protein [Actinomycetota bacterium]
MTRGGRRAWALAAGAILALVVLAGPAAATSGAQPASPRRQVFLFLVDRASFEEVLAVPELAALARAGGAGLANFLIGGDDVSLEPYVMLGSGVRAAAPFGRIAPAGELVSGSDLAALEAENDRAVPGLLGEALADGGLAVGVLGNADDRAGVNAPGLLAGMDEDGRIPDARVAGLTVSAPGRLGGLRTDGAALIAESERM